MTKAIVSSKGQIVDLQGEALVMKRMVRNYPDWHTMRGIAKGGESLTDALTRERAAELAHDNARINQGR
jgi:hypothetical protein